MIATFQNQVAKAIAADLDDHDLAALIDTETTMGSGVRKQVVDHHIQSTIGTLLKTAGMDRSLARAQWIASFRSVKKWIA